MVRTCGAVPRGSLGMQTPHYRELQRSRRESLLQPTPSAGFSPPHTTVLVRSEPNSSKGDEDEPVMSSHLMTNNSAAKNANCAQ